MVTPHSDFLFLVIPQRVTISPSLPSCCPVPTWMWGTVLFLLALQSTPPTRADACCKLTLYERLGIPEGVTSQHHKQLKTGAPGPFPPQSPPLTGQLSSVASHSPTIWFLSLHHWPPLIHSSVSLTFIRRSHSDLPLSHHFSKSSFWGGGEASSFTPKQPSGEFPKQRIISPNMENATGLFWQTSCCRFSVLVFNGDFLSSCCICMCCWKRREAWGSLELSRLFLPLSSLILHG